MSYVKVCDTSALDPAEAMSVTLSASDGHEVVVAVVRDEDGDWHAIGDTCTHGDVSLSEGDVEDGCIECWGHSAVFDLETGEPTLPATQPTPVFKLQVDGDDVLVDVDSPKQ